LDTPALDWIKAQRNSGFCKLTGIVLDGAYDEALRALAASPSSKMDLWLLTRDLGSEEPTPGCPEPAEGASFEDVAAFR